MVVSLKQNGNFETTDVSVDSVVYLNRLHPEHSTKTQ